MSKAKQAGGLKSARRVVVKIGSALLADTERGTVRRQWLESLATDLADFRKRDREVIVVSSGAIAVGRRHLHFPDRNLKLDEKQAAAATGMMRLAHAYQDELGKHGLTVAQVLLTLDDTENRRRYINARNTIEALLRVGAVPLINENDTVATDEIRFGDNDRLAARVAAMIGADTLILLTDIDGLYTADPNKDAQATLISEVREVTAGIEAMAGEAPRGLGTGGMVTKLAAAKVCLAAGCRMVIARGSELHPLRELAKGSRCTWFMPSATPQTARKRWIAGTLKPAGVIIVDAGALKALNQGKSLLPAGVSEIEGRFGAGDAVIVRDTAGHEVARGLSAYSAKDARRIMGHKSAEIESILGYRGGDEMIHRDDLVLS
jgi:glutamate 5-kinase